MEGHDDLSVADIPRLSTSAQLPLLPNPAANDDSDENDTKPAASETQAGQTVGQVSSLRDDHVRIEDASNQDDDDDIDESDTITPASKNRGNESTNHASSLSDPNVTTATQRNGLPVGDSPKPSTPKRVKTKGFRDGFRGKRDQSNLLTSRSNNLDT